MPFAITRVSSGVSELSDAAILRRKILLLHVPFGSPTKSASALINPTAIATRRMHALSLSVYF